MMKTKLEQAVSPECPELLRRSYVNESVQKPGEAITAFITDLLLLVKYCDKVVDKWEISLFMVYLMKNERRDW